jgi:hypothetical protein
MEQTSALSPEALKALRAEYASKATDDQFNLWIEECRSKDLRPVEDVVLQIRTSKEYDPDLKAKVAVKKAVYITTIRALTKIASRTGKYKGKLPTEWIYTSPTFQPSIISTIPLPDPENPRLPLEPWAARVRVQHADFPEPVEEVVRFHAYAQTYRNGPELGLERPRSGAAGEVRPRRLPAFCFPRGGQLLPGRGNPAA